MIKPTLNHFSQIERERLGKLSSIFSIIPHSSSLFEDDCFHLNLPYLDPKAHCTFSITKTYEPVNMIVSYVTAQFDPFYLEFTVINSFTNLELALRCIEKEARDFCLSIQEVSKV